MITALLDRLFPSRALLRQLVDEATYARYLLSSANRRLAILNVRVYRMTVSQAEFAAALASEGTEIAALSTSIAALVAKVDLMIAAVPGSPDFTDQFNQVRDQRIALGVAAAAISDEIAKIVPAPPVTPPAPPVPVVEPDPAPEAEPDLGGAVDTHAGEVAGA